MNDMQWVWIALAVLAILLVLGVVAARAHKRRTDERHRVEAGRIREQAAEQERDLRVEEARAAESEASAHKARAEADERAAEARRLEIEAEHRSGARDELREDHERRLRHADALDPDVRTDKHGRRLDDGRTVADDRAEWDVRHVGGTGHDESLADEVYGIDRTPHDARPGRTSHEDASHDEAHGSPASGSSRVERHITGEPVAEAPASATPVAEVPGAEVPVNETPVDEGPVDEGSDAERRGDGRSSLRGSHAAARPATAPLETSPDDDAVPGADPGEQPRDRSDRPMVREFRAEEAKVRRHPDDPAEQNDARS